MSMLNPDCKSISPKAAKMLGIDPSAAQILDWSPTQSPVDLPDSYNHHRTRFAPPPPPPRSVSLSTAAHLQSYPHSHPHSDPCAPTHAYTHLHAYSPHTLQTIPQVPYDAALDAQRLWKALNKSKRKPDTGLLSTIVVAASRQQWKLCLLKQKYRELYGQDVAADVRAATSSGNYRTALTRLLAGPREAEALALNNDSAFFLDEKLMAEALFGKGPRDVQEIRLHFERLHGLPLSTVLENLSLFSGPVSAGLVFAAAGPANSFSRACLQALKVQRDVETVESLAAMDAERLRQRNRRLARDGERLYHQDHAATSTGSTDSGGGSSSSSSGGGGSSGAKHLNQEALLEIVLQRSDLYLAELCRSFYESHGKQLPELALAKDRAHFSYGVVCALPVTRTCHYDPTDKAHRAMRWRSC